MKSANIASRFLRSTGAATFSQLWRVVVTFGTSLLLKRLIPDVDWGLWHWALPIFLVLGAIRDLGLVYHVVRVKPRPYGNLLLLEVVWGGFMVAATCIGAPLLSSAYTDGHTEIIGILRALSLYLFFEGLSTVPRVYFEGELAIGRAVVPEIIRNFVLAATSVGLALSGFGIWSLVTAHVASAAVYAIHLWWRAWGEIPLVWERGATLSLVRRSLPLAAIWFLIILVRYIDPLILGALYSGKTVGNYGFAYENAFRVSEIIVPAVVRSLYPALVAFGDEVSRLFRAYGLATIMMLSLEVPAAFFLFLNADLALRILGGNQWEGASTFLRILCFAPLADPFSRLGGELLKARHRDGLWIASSVITLATFLVGGILLTRAFGPVGMAWINLLPLGGVLMAWGIYKMDPPSFRRLLANVAFVYFVPIPIFISAWLLSGDRVILRLVLSLLSVAISLLIFGWRFGGDFRAFFKPPTVGPIASAD